MGNCLSMKNGNIVSQNIKINLLLLNSIYFNPNPRCKTRFRKQTINMPKSTLIIIYQKSKELLIHSDKIISASNNSQLVNIYQNTYEFMQQQPSQVFNMARKQQHPSSLHSQSDTASIGYQFFDNLSQGKCKERKHKIKIPFIQALQKGQDKQKQIKKLRKYYQEISVQMQIQQQLENVYYQAKQHIFLAMRPLEAEKERLEQKRLKAKAQLEKEAIFLHKLKKEHFTQMLNDCQQKIEVNTQRLKQEGDQYETAKQNCARIRRKLQRLDFLRKAITFELKELLRND